MSEIRIPDRLEPAVAYRVWLLDVRRGLRRGYGGIRNDDFASLVSLNWPKLSTPWPSRRELKAACEAGGEHPAPDPACRCGVYGLKTPEALEQPLLWKLAEALATFARSYSGGDFGRRGPWLVCGRVNLWGR